jgi:hypothetical protein
MDQSGNRESAEKAFRDWRDGAGSITDLLADNLRWTIVGRSQVSKTFESKEEFVGEVLQPFGARCSQPFRSVGQCTGSPPAVTPWSSCGTGRAPGLTGSPTRTPTRGL